MRTIRGATASDADEVLALYRSLIGSEGCSWDEFYPAPEDIDADIENGGLYVLEEDGAITAAGATGFEREQYNIGCWRSKNPAEIFRLGVMADKQGGGRAGELLSFLIKNAAGEGHDGCTLFVNPNNAHALKLYASAGFEKRGECDMYELHWICEELYPLEGRRT